MLVLNLGAVVFQNEFCIVRAKTVVPPKKNGIPPRSPKVQIAVHQKDSNGTELTPRGYVIGHNMLQYEGKI